MNKTTCPQRQQIAAYMLGAVDEHELEAVGVHLAGCPHCQAIADELESSLSDELTDLLHGPEPTDDFSNEPECQHALARAMEIVDTRPEPSETNKDRKPDEKLLLPQKLGEYLLLEEIGGHMGTVYKALHTTMDRFVAVKVLPARALANEEAVGRFQREMKAIGRLEHPHIVRAYDAREIDGRHLLVMELVDGKNLSDVILSKGPLPVADACEAVRQAAVGLQYVCGKGLVHRDVKPSNLMLTPEGQVKLLDLGLARFCTRRPEAEEMTGAWHVLGTANYMAPEQAASSRDVDIRADIYSLGCTLYKLLTGRAPFDDPKYEGTSDVLDAHRYEPSPSIKKVLPDVSDALAAVLDRMLARSPSDRFETPGQVAEALEPFTVGCDLRALGAGWGRERQSGSRPAKLPRRQPFPWLWKLTAAAAVLMLLVVGGKWGIGRLDRLPADHEPGPIAMAPQPTPVEPKHEPQTTPPTRAGQGPQQETPLTAASLDQSESEPSTPGEGTAAPGTETASLGVPGGAEPQQAREQSGATDPVDPGPSRPPTTGFVGSGAPGGAPAEPPERRPYSLASMHNEQAAFVVSLDVDHPDRIYYGPPAGPDGTGEVMHATVKSSKSGYLYLMYQTVDREIKCLFPNKIQQDNKIVAGREIMVPHPDAEFLLRAGPPYGKELLKAVVTLVPLEPERFGVSTLTAANFTPLQSVAVKNMFVELKEEPVNWAEHQVQITTMPGEPAEAPADDVSGYRWQDGFLEREYTEPQGQLQKVLDSMFEMCIAVETTLVEDEGGIIRSWGVGDKAGNYGSWRSVGTIEELDVQDGGVVVAVKEVKYPHTITIGFKVGGGDKAASETLHRVLAQGGR